MKPTDTRSKILDTAQELIQKLGVNAMSYADISTAVGIRKASIHYYFPSKEDLLSSLLERYNPSFLRLVDAILESPDSAEIKLRRYCGLFEDTLNSGEQDKACLCGMLGAEVKTLNSPLAEQISYFYQENEIRLVKLLTQGIETGVFSFSGETAAMAKLIFSLLEGELLIARAHSGVAHFPVVVEQLFQLLKA
ncbi:transcriptional regulator [Xenococcus sp. PCC 7305]|uniref:TetR/AcrR family transcriptional regulator n=1 Tax=Xenococcus sp. PCC 7305 TaxID=102125 RepID=UPI0002AC676F|nr:TetR/AcrR family transcriptional regulator [Xenococcus sp. PCC 7305]ELS05150.1 transcriptional regulator [Xenococcus sp. PCC 7305]